MTTILSNITNYEIMKRHLTMKLVPEGRIKKYDGVKYPVRKWFDLCIVPSVVWGDASMDVSFEIAESWEVEMETVFHDAMENLEMQTEYMLFEDMMDELNRKCSGSNDPEMREILDNYDPKKERFPMYVLSNKLRSFGAASLLNVSAITDIAKHCKSNLIVIPSSIHELILVPLSVFGDRTLEYITEDLSATVTTVNRSMVRPEDQLSNHPYLFGRDYFGEWSYTSLEMSEWDDLEDWK